MFDSSSIESIVPTAAPASVPAVRSLDDLRKGIGDYICNDVYRNISTSKFKIVNRSIICRHRDTRQPLLIRKILTELINPRLGTTLSSDSSADTTMQFK